MSNNAQNDVTDMPESGESRQLGIVKGSTIKLVLVLLQRWGETMTFLSIIQVFL